MSVLLLNPIIGNCIWIEYILRRTEETKPFVCLLTQMYGCNSKQCLIAVIKHLLRCGVRAGLRGQDNTVILLCISSVEDYFFREKK